jgi:subtilisin family serine protease
MDHSNYKSSNYNSSKFTFFIELRSVNKYILFLLFVFFQITASSQSSLYWHWKDLEKDSVHGVSLQKAKQILATKTFPTPIIVAILDGGIDTNHIDLKNKLWKNLKEIPNNGIDDDQNGYVDDLHGWNFLGGKNGENINKLSAEKTRIYHQYKNEFLNKNVDTLLFSEAKKSQYKNWLAANNELEFTEEDQANLAYITSTKNVIKRVTAKLIPEMNDSSFTIEKLEDYLPIGRVGLEAKRVLIKSVNILGLDKSSKINEIISDLDEYIEGKEKTANAKEMEPEDIRAKIIKDHYFDFNDRYYGNNDIMGPNAKHGTHVAGLASYQENYIQIMGVRVVPDGDEYDKDIALGIRYAVDNGAKVINMSFGKSYSPQQAWVDSAIRYAASKDVLLIHSAGNEKYDLNSKSVYPNPYSPSIKDSAENMLTIAASSDSVIKGSLVTDFSNFGNKVVDLLSPGEKIYSTLPNNEYGYLSGTSMASPIVTHIAAMIRAYYPNLSARDVKNILLLSCTPPKDKSAQLELSYIAKKGGIVNAANAIEIASHYKPSKRKIQKTK